MAATQPRVQVPAEALERVLPLLPPYMALRDWARLLGASRELRTATLALLHGRSSGHSAWVADLGEVPLRRLPAAVAFIGARLAGRVALLALPSGARLPAAVALLPVLGPSLTHLDVGGLRGRLAECLGATDLGARCPQLKHLDLSGSGPLPLQLLASFNGRHRLEALLLTGCPLECGTRELLEALPPLPALALLELSKGQDGSQGPQLEGLSVAEGLLAPSKGTHPYPALATLGLAGQRSLAAEDIAAAARLPSLRHLNLMGAAGGAAQQRALESAGLEVLLLGAADAAGEDLPDGAWGTAACVGSLRVLDASGHTKLSDAGVRLLGQCQRLQKLTLARQPKPTPDGLLALLRALPSLQTVVAVRCRRLHAKALAKVQRQLLAGGRHATLLLERQAPGSWWLE